MCFIDDPHCKFLEYYDNKKYIIHSKPIIETAGSTVFSGILLRAQNNGRSQMIMSGQNEVLTGQTGHVDWSCSPYF